MKMLKEKQCLALFEVVCLGQYPGVGLRPTRAERKAARWAHRVLQEQKRLKRPDDWGSRWGRSE